MSGGNRKNGFTLLESLFAVSLLAVLATAGLFAIRSQANADFLQKDMSEMDHAAYSILAIISPEIRNAGFYGDSSPVFFVDGGEAVDKAAGRCDPGLSKKDGTDCITFESVKYGGEGSVRKSFFVRENILKMWNSDSSRIQSLTPDGAGVKVEDFQIRFITDGTGVFQNSMESGKPVEAIKVTLTLKSRGSHGNRKDGHIRKTYSAVVNPRNM